MSKDKLLILIKILAESHNFMAFDWEIKSTFDSTHSIDQPYFLPLFKACCMGMLAHCLAGLAHAHEEVENRAGLSDVCY